MEAASPKAVGDQAWWGEARVRIQAAIEHAGVTVEQIAADYADASPSLTAEQLRAAINGESEINVRQLRAIAAATGLTLGGLLLPKPAWPVEEPAEATVRALMTIIERGQEDRWLNRNHADAWKRELKVVLRRLQRATQLENELTHRNAPTDISSEERCAGS